MVGTTQRVVGCSESGDHTVRRYWRCPNESCAAVGASRIAGCRPPLRTGDDLDSADGAVEYRRAVSRVGFVCGQAGVSHAVPPAARRCPFASPARTDSTWIDADVLSPERRGLLGAVLGSIPEALRRDGSLSGSLWMVIAAARCRSAACPLASLDDGGALSH